MGSREHIPSPHSPRNSAPFLTTGDSDRSYCPSPEAAGTPNIRSSMSDTSSPEPGNPDILRELLERKRSLMLISLQESQQGSADAMSCNASDAGSIITNPAFYRQKLSHQSFRSTVSEGDPDGVRRSIIEIKQKLTVLCLVARFSTTERGLVDQVVHNDRLPVSRRQHDQHSR